MNAVVDSPTEITLKWAKEDVECFANRYMITYEVTNQGQCGNELFSPAGEWLTVDDLTLVDNMYCYTLTDLYSYSNYKFTVTPGSVDSMTGNVIGGRDETIEETTTPEGRYS